VHNIKDVIPEHVRSVRYNLSPSHSNAIHVARMDAFGPAAEGNAITGWGDKGAFMGDKDVCRLEIGEDDARVVDKMWTLKGGNPQKPS
jgi:hypothetical protein